MKMLKKTLSVLLAAMVVMAMCSLASFAETNSFTIDARENVADFKEVTVGTDTTPETPEEWAHGGFMIRPGEWIKYSLPNGLKKGTYELKAKIANYEHSVISVVVNEGKPSGYEAAPDIVPETMNPETGGRDGSMQFFTERVLGKVVLGGDNNTLTFGHSKWYSFVLKSFTLTYVSENEVYEVHFRAPVDYVHKNGSTAMPIDEYISSGANVLPKVMTLRGGEDNYYILDIGFLPSATYSIGVESASAGSFKVDCYLGKTADSVTTLRKSNVVIPASGGWNTLTENNNVTEMYFSDGMKYLKIDPVSASGAVQVYAITFTKVNKDIFSVNAKSDCVDYSHDWESAPFYTVTTSTPTILAQGVATLRTATGNYYTYDFSGIEKGTYEVYADYISQQAFKFDLYTGNTADAVTKNVASDLMLPVNGKWTDDFFLTSEKLCEFYIAGDVNFVKIVPKSGVTELGKLTLKKVSSENMIDTVIPYNETISDEAGVGFYVKNGNTVYDTFEPAIATLSKTMTAVRAGNWYKYDLSSVPAGKYTLVLDMASYLGNTAIDVEINDELILDNASIYSSGVYNEIGTPKKVAVATIDIPEITSENEKNILKLTGAINAFNLKSIILTKTPQVNVIYERGTGLDKTLTTDVFGGKMYFDAFGGVSYEGKDALVTFAVYKTNNETGTVQLYKVYTQYAEDGIASGSVEEIAIEEGYTYTQKVFVWDCETLQGFSF